MEHREVRVVVHLDAAPAHLAEQRVLLRAHEIRVERQHRRAAHREVAQDEETLVRRPRGMGAVAATHRACARHRRHGRALHELEATASGRRVVGSTEHVDRRVGARERGETGQQVGLHGHVVVEEQEPLAARVVQEDVARRPGIGARHRADAGLRKAGPDGLRDLRITVRADEQLERRRVDLLLQARQTGVQ